MKDRTDSGKKAAAATGLTALLVCACSLVSRKPADPTVPVVPFPFPPTETSSAKDAAKGTVEPATLEEDLERRLRDEPGESMRFFVRYRQAQVWSATDKAKACDHWLEAAAEPRFPLHRVARLHAMETCPSDKGTFPSVDEIAASESAPWLKEAVTRAALSRAVTNADEAREMKLQFESHRFERKQTDKVKRLERTLALARKLADTATEASAQKALQAVAPRFDTNPPPERYMSVGNDFRQARQFAKAREWYAKALAHDSLDDATKLVALDGVRMSYKLEKDVPSFIKATHDYSQFARDRFLDRAKGKLNAHKRGLLSKYLETQITLARAVWTEGSARQARELMEKAENEIRGRVSIASSQLLRARIEEESGRFNEAVKILEKVDEKALHRADRSLLAKIFWYKAWNQRKLARLEDASRTLENLLTFEVGATFIARDRFWLARTLGQMGQKDRAKAEFEWLMENDPLGYYGLLAHRELGLPMARLGSRSLASDLPPPLAPASIEFGPSISTETKEDPKGLVREIPAVLANADALTPDEKLVFEWLMAVNENDLGRRFLDQISPPRRSSYSQAQSFDLLQAYARTGQFHSLFARVLELDGPTRKKLIESRPELYFPRPWRELVDDAARRFDVPAELVYSIMRQESSFDSSARSHADAFGLMQLIPEVARVAGKRADLTLEHHEDLYRPELNIPLGTAFLRDLLDRWKGKFIPTVASYNASEKAISGWLKTRLRGDVLEFIEDVPYDETKTYLKLVMRNFVFYSRLNSTPATAPASPPAPVPFPEWCLADLQDIKP